MPAAHHYSLDFVGAIGFSNGLAAVILTGRFQTASAVAA